MAYKVKKSKNGSIIVSLESITVLEKKYKAFFEGGGLRQAAEFLSERAFSEMKAQYMVTKSDSFGRRRKHRRKSLEDKLFGGGAPVVFQKGNNKYEFSIVPKDIDRSFPHFKWQERGTKKMVDTQPYIVTSRGPRPITKEAARSLPKARHRFRSKKTGRFIRDIGRIRYLKVPHPRLKARGFVLAANMYLKSGRASKEVTEKIKGLLGGI